MDVCRVEKKWNKNWKVGSRKFLERKDNHKGVMEGVWSFLRSFLGVSLFEFMWYLDSSASDLL